MVTIIVLQIVLGIMGSMVVAAFSRWREFRADAGGANLAGRTKMISALKVLQARYERDETITSSQKQTSIAAFKISGKSGGFLALLASHPALDERIERLQQANI